MVTKLCLRPTTSFPVTTIFFFTKPSLHKLTIITSIHSTTHRSTLTSESSFLYGPSLHKGKNPFENPSQKHQQKQIQDWGSHSPSGSRMIKEESPYGASEFDQEFFARVFDIAALRVPARECFDLEKRIRGHLLNWPRIRNIARVPGDEVEEKIGALLGDDKRNGSEEEDEEGKKIDVLNRRIYGRAEGDGEKLSPVLYRERLAKEFNARGFVRFRNLAKISRPKRKKKKGKEGRGEESERQGNDRKGKDKFAMVEVVEEEEGEDWKGLLGEEFKGRRNWRGSTRLLLLDERYAQKSVEDLPQAIKVANPNSLDALLPVLQVALQEAMGKSSPFTFELVRCKLTLYYDYWQMNEILETLLPKDMIIPSSFETVGHIAHLNLRDEHLPYKKLIAKVVLDKNKPKIQTVVNKIDAIHNDYRTMQLEVLAGNHSLVTTVIESGMRFHVDLATVYWNSKLATERQRLVNGFTCRDVVCDIFSGVGPIAISAARVVKRVYANDLNPYAVDFLERNSVLNKLEKKIEVFNMDGRRFINAMFSSEKAQSITQVVMNLPNDAAEYLDAFRGIFRDKPKNRQFSMPMIHVYGFSKASDPEFDFHERIRIALEEVAVDVEMRRVRLVAPGKWMLCASFRLPVSVAYADAYAEDAK